MEPKEVNQILKGLGLPEAFAVSIDNNLIPLLCRRGKRGTCLHTLNNPQGGLVCENGTWIIRTRQSFTQCRDCPKPRSTPKSPAQSF